MMSVRKACENCTQSLVLFEFLQEITLKFLLNHNKKEFYVKFKPKFRKFTQNFAIILKSICEVLSRETQAELALQGGRKDI